MLGKDTVESFGVSEEVNEEDRGPIPGRLGWGLGERWLGLRGAGEWLRLLKGDGDPEGVEWPERRSSHILDSDGAGLLKPQGVMSWMQCSARLPRPRELELAAARLEACALLAAVAMLRAPGRAAGAASPRR